MTGCNVDPTLRALGGRGQYQLLQLLAINLGAWGGAFQLFDNIFIGRKVTWHQCSPPRSLEDSRRAAKLLDSPVNWTSAAEVSYGQCQITVRNDLRHVATYPCLFGYDYAYPRELSFRTEFDLVCDHALLADFLQTLVILGQGCGAVLASMISDRYGRKRVLVYSQFGLLGVGMAIGMAPTYTSLALLKFLVGCVQQGVVTGKATMSIELFPSERRSLAAMALAAMWVIGNTILAVSAYLLQDSSWRTLQCALSAVSLFAAMLQLWYLDESLRWLVANGKKEAAELVLRRAARVNGIDVGAVLRTLHASELLADDLPIDQKAASATIDLHDPKAEASIDDIRKRSKLQDEDWEMSPSGAVAEDGIPLLDSSDQPEAGIPARTKKKTVHKLTVYDLFRHRRLRLNTMIIWVTWFTCAFCNFTLYLMSTGLHGNRFLNFFLIALTEIPAFALFYCIVDRAGRKPTIQLFFILSAAGIVSSGFFRVFQDSQLFGVLSVLTAMLAMMGSTGVFGSMFFYTPEVYPTNIRQQALGLASSAGRLGGMIAPFMVPVSEIVVWLPGAVTGMLCLLVIVLLRFLPETQGRELPQTLEDIDAWEVGDSSTDLCLAPLVGFASRWYRRWTRSVKKWARSVRGVVFESHEVVMMPSRDV